MHTEEGAFGLVLNRPLVEEPLEGRLPEWSQAASLPAVLFRGGPVHPTAGAALARISGQVPQEGWTPLIANVGMFALERPPAEPFFDLTALRIFSGYSGWTGGQLDSEVKDGGWFVVATEAGDLFTAEPETLWRRVLQRQDGPLAMFAHFPVDPRAN
jgi:putative transcriptional regulator